MSLVNMWNAKPVSDERPGLAKCNALTLPAEAPHEAIAQLAKDAHLSLVKLDRLIESLRARAQRGDRHAYNLLVVLTSDAYDLFVATQMDAEEP